MVLLLYDFISLIFTISCVVLNSNECNQYKLLPLRKISLISCSELYLTYFMWSSNVKKKHWKNESKITHLNLITGSECCLCREKAPLKENYFMFFCEDGRERKISLRSKISQQELSVNSVNGFYDFYANHLTALDMIWRQSPYLKWIFASSHVKFYVKKSHLCTDQRTNEKKVRFM